MEMAQCWRVGETWDRRSYPLKYHVAERAFPAYDAEKFGKPWGARLYWKDGAVCYDFKGFWYGDAVHGGVVAFGKVCPGDVLAVGQKSHDGKSRTNLWYVVTDDYGVVPIDRDAAKERLRPAPVPRRDDFSAESRDRRYGRSIMQEG